jgi:hypothetical protein
MLVARRLPAVPGSAAKPPWKYAVVQPSALCATSVLEDFRMFSLLLGLAISMAVAALGYSRARAFVSERLRYVDAVNHPLAPLLAGAGAFFVGALIAGFLPIVGVGTALTFGLAVGLGVSAGRGDVPRFPRA